MKIENLRASLAIAMTALAISLPGSLPGMQTPPTQPATAKPARKAPPTAAEIADAKSKGLVWANLNTKVYHKDDAQYGTTKNGQFMSEADATKAGFRLARTSPVGKKKAPAAPAPQK